MTKTAGLLLACAALASTTAHADVSLNSVRVVAKDAEALGKFYAAAFGLKETNRLNIANGVELFLNFGATVEAARGTVVREPSAFGNTGIVISFVADTEGNRIELIQPARR